MQKRVITLPMIIVGASLGISFLPPAQQAIGQQSNGWLNNTSTNSLLGALIFFLLSLLSAKHISAIIKQVEQKLSEVSSIYFLFGVIGAIIGLTLGVVISTPLYNMEIPFVNNALPTLLIIILDYLGLGMGTARVEEWKKVFGSRSKKIKQETASQVGSQLLERRSGENFHKYKILDASVIIDDRIYDITKTGSLEGTLTTPSLVLYELQHIADSGDSLKRVRGCRGLDILDALQKEEGISAGMYDEDFEDISEVDSKLIRLARPLDGVTVINDYNLNKVSKFQNVPVLNVNALANAVKPVVIPGETMNALVVKTGTEHQQGVAYLDDGTTVVVEDGQHYMNERIEVVITSVLQTVAGRMIFTKPAHAGRGIDNKEEIEKKTKQSK